jgi:hypothetical protein
VKPLNLKECKKISGGKTDWDEWARYNGYGGMPNPPNFKDFSQAVGEGAMLGAYVGGPIGAAEGAFGGGVVYILGNATYNIKNYYF